MRSRIIGPHSWGKDIELAILFADVVGSTRLYDTMGDLRARDMVAICIDVMRTATEQRQGTVIKTMGDEVMPLSERRRRLERRGADASSRSPRTHILNVDGQPVAIRNRLPLRSRDARESRRLRRRRAHLPTA